MQFFKFDRTYSFFEPDYSYNVSTAIGGNIGGVARIGRHWYADNKRWNYDRDIPGATVGGQLARKFATRHEAATALWHICNGTDPAVYGGYVLADAS